jgi:hypothetical protein
MLSARERLLQGAGGSEATRGQSSAMMNAIQQSPGWLRPLILILPVSRRWPIDETVSGYGKRKRNGALLSSDEENRGNRGGYGSQLRYRKYA